MKFTSIVLIAGAIFMVSNTLAAGQNSVDSMLATYKADAKLPFSAKRGEEFWNKKYPETFEGKPRRCALCHMDNLKIGGKHVKTGKDIDAMAPSVNSKRFVKVKKIKKWFKRNCKWTLGRECSAQEKGDVLLFLSQQ